MWGSDLAAEALLAEESDGVFVRVSEQVDSIVPGRHVLLPAVGPRVSMLRCTHSRALLFPMSTFR